MGKANNNLQNIDKFAAQQQHQATVKLLNWSLAYQKLMESVPHGNEFDYLIKLLRSAGPVPAQEIQDEKQFDNKVKRSQKTMPAIDKELQDENAPLSSGAISQRFIRLNIYLSSFSINLNILKIRNIRVEIPRRPVTESHFGYYLACFDMRNNRYLSGKEILGVLATTDFVYFRIPEEVLEVNDNTAAQWFRPDGPFYSDFAKEMYYRRNEVTDIRTKLMSRNSNSCLLVGDGATGKTTIAKTLIYDLYTKDKLNAVYYFDISPKRYFDEVQLFKEIQATNGTFIIENIHLRQQTIQSIYKHFKTDPDRHFLFTARQPCDENSRLILKDLPDIHTIPIEPFVDADKLVDRFCDDPETPGVVRDNRYHIFKISQNDFWLLIYALKGCVDAHGKGDPQSWIKNQVSNYLSQSEYRDIESGHGQYADQYPGILVSLSPLYINEVLTSEIYLKKLGFTKAAINALVERGEITRQVDKNNNVLFGLLHSSRAKAFWEHGKAYLSNKELRLIEFIYDYAISDTPNGLEAVMKSPYPKELCSRLEREGLFSDVIMRETSIEEVSRVLIIMCSQRKSDAPLDDKILQRIAEADNFYYSCQCLLAISYCDQTLAKQMCESIIVSKVVEDLFMNYGFQEFVIATQIISKILKTKGEELWEAALPQILLQLDTLNAREVLCDLKDMAQQHPKIAKEITIALKEEFVAEKLIQTQNLSCIVCCISTILCLDSNKGKDIWNKLQKRLLSMLYNEEASTIASAFSRLINADKILAKEFFMSIQYPKLASTLKKEAQWQEVANIIKIIQPVDIAASDDLHGAFDDQEQKHIDPYL